MARRDYGGQFRHPCHAGWAFDAIEARSGLRLHAETIAPIKR
jgi:hypothetical protein